MNPSSNSATTNASLSGLMQHDFPLTVQRLLIRMRRYSPQLRVISRDVDGAFQTTTHLDIVQRVGRLCNSLVRLGVGMSDRVATLAWNSREHLELYLGVPAMGAVIHTLNPRLSIEQLAYIVNHAEDSVLVADESLIEMATELRQRSRTIQHLIVIGQVGDEDTLSYEELLAAEDSSFEYRSFEDVLAASLCYTSGTTGNPKGVLYSHRSLLLHSLAVCLPDVTGICSSDTVLQLAPMFHVNGWGLPYAAVMVGADLLMLGRTAEAEVIANVIEQQKVTFTAAVPTVCADLLRYSDTARPNLSTLRMIWSGGSAVPMSLIQGFHDRHGVEVVQGWGMTETSPLALVARPPKGTSFDDSLDLRAAAGRPHPMVDARVVSDDGKEIAWDGHSLGELQVRSPWVASAYFREESPGDKFDDGWLRTGDMATVDSNGFIRIVDRIKDLIKSGGEWISSVELESHLAAHPDVIEAAVIGQPNDRWSERPLACVVLRSGASAGSEQLREHLMPRVPKWWIPDEFVFLDSVPKTSVGKFDKKLLRQQLQSGMLGVRD